MIFPTGCVDNMKDQKRLLACMVVYNTCLDTSLVLNRFPKERGFDILIVNDGSIDNTKEILEKSGLIFINHSKNRGVGAAMRTGIDYGLKNDYYAIAILAGNNKDDPCEIGKLFNPILNEDYDYVQGSRFLKGGRWDNLPVFRYIMVKLHAFLFYLLTGFKGTDALNGFRAYRLVLFKDNRINIWQGWLDKYELETYLHYKVIRLGYKVKEVPVSKIYPNDKKKKYSHIRPIIDWWKILRPLLFLCFNLKK